MKEDHEDLSISLDVEGTGYHEQNAYGSLSLSAH